MIYVTHLFVLVLICTYFLLKESETGSQEVMVGSVWLYHKNEKKITQ